MMRLFHPCEWNIEALALLSLRLFWNARKVRKGMLGAKGGECRVSTLIVIISKP